MPEIIRFNFRIRRYVFNFKITLCKKGTALDRSVNMGVFDKFLDIMKLNDDEYDDDDFYDDDFEDDDFDEKPHRSIFRKQEEQK